MSASKNATFFNFRCLHGFLLRMRFWMVCKSGFFAPGNFTLAETTTAGSGSGFHSLLRIWSRDVESGQVLRTVHCLIVVDSFKNPFDKGLSCPFHTHRAEDRTLTWANFRTLLRPQLFRHRRICGCWMFHLSDVQFPRTVIPQSVPVPVSGTI